MSYPADRHFLDVSQLEAFEKWRERVVQYIIEETEAFYIEHPELQLTWSFSSDPLIRGRHSSLRDGIGLIPL